ncbi:glycine--tRNA ligase subunit beta [Ventosimonas gracilis]|uniref:Glycine--tRNA ligase beta subunit n=1 Tax=Ventosimonas gracilis TaxID=1680762 RepID=A0A139SSV0_9GAMM|nr:glycine--tRNA ligase subunit beta [Ventosimonas gracilis]KXU37551.1 glycine--tRNA ligase subunit beta [Ventosimonas gracilis]
MSREDFLVELGCQELPPKALNDLSEAFARGIESGLAAASLRHGKIHRYGAPRRLAVRVDSLISQQPEREERIDGPPLSIAFDSNGLPTAAAQGFANKCGASLNQLDKSGSKLCFSRRIPGQSSRELLPAIVEAALAALPIPKRMRWGARREEFVRPTEWLLMLYGEQVIDCCILGQQAGALSYGHRFHHPQAVSVQRPASYLDDLRRAHVLADFAERRRLIERRCQALAEAEGGRAIMPPGLLDEVTALVEWPVPLVCSFEERFLAVPQEALIMTMQDNQKYFCLLDAQGKLLPRFIAVANLESKDAAQIIAGNEKVVRPRLADAEFFFNQDQKYPLQDLNARLAQVVFQAQLGSLQDKAARLAKLSRYIAEGLDLCPEQAERAGLLAKADLVSEMVGEFPAMQGIAGYYYAHRSGEDEAVALAIKEQYLPAGPSSPVPASILGAVLALAERIDTLVGIFAIGQLPSGSKDPYGLRRAALGVLRILIEKKIDLDLPAVLNTAAALYAEKVATDGVAAQVSEFILDRLRAYYEDQGIDFAAYQAVRVLEPVSPYDFNLRVRAVQEFRQLPQAAALAAANKRVHNLLSKSDEKRTGKVEAHYFELPAEFSLFAAIGKAQQAITPLVSARNYSEVLLCLARLDGVVNGFFEVVLVNAENAKIRANRHALLGQLRALFLKVADISLLG